MKRARPISLREATLCIGLLSLLRLVVHYLYYQDPIALLEISGLDVGLLLLTALAFAAGPTLGAYFASVIVTVLLLGLPLVVLGYLAEVLDGRHLSDLMGLSGLLGIGVGFCIAASEKKFLWLLGLPAVGGAVYGLTQIHQVLESLLIAAPSLLLVLLLVVLRRSIFLELIKRSPQNPDSPASA